VAAGEAEDERDEPRGVEAAPARRSEKPQRLLPSSESWTDRVATAGNKSQASLIQAIKAAIKAIVKRDPDAPQPKKKRRRSGGTESRAPVCVRHQLPQQRVAACGRYSKLQPSVAKVTTITSTRSVPKEYFSAGCAWDVFDITGFSYEHGFAECDAGFDTRASYLSPGL
jgi:hypothetical protein